MEFNKEFLKRNNYVLCVDSVGFLVYEHAEHSNFIRDRGEWIDATILEISTEEEDSHVFNIYGVPYVKLHTALN